jgi:hypothetical protein
LDYLLKVQIIASNIPVAQCSRLVKRIETALQRQHTYVACEIGPGGEGADEKVEVCDGVPSAEREMVVQNWLCYIP